MRLRRICLLFGLLATPAFLAPSGAAAHGFGQRYDLPVGR